MPLEKVLKEDGTIIIRYIAPFNKVQPSIKAPSYIKVSRALAKLRDSTTPIQNTWLDTIEAFIKTR